MARRFVRDPIPDSRAALDRLAERVTGRMLTPWDADFDEARAVWNGMIDCVPHAIVRAADLADVEAVLETARETRLPLAVRGGGHSVAGLGTIDDGIVLDLGALREVRVDPATQRVTAAPGARVGDVDAATAPHGLAVPLGTVPSPGVAGLTLGGGIGWLVRMAGLSLDALVEAEVLTADGRRLTASADSHPGLFWGLRGGGGNFGIVTSLTYRAVPMPAMVLGASLHYERPQWRRALGAFERWSRDLPDELAAVITVAVPPANADFGDDPLLTVQCVWIGEDPSRGEEIVQRLARAVPPAQTLIGEVSWESWQGARSELLPDGARGVWRNASFQRVDEEVLDALTDVAAAMPGRGAVMDLHLLGGAFARIPEGTTAFPHRGGRLMVSLQLAWSDPGDDERLLAFGRQAGEALARLRAGGEYVNFRSIERTRPLPETTRETYGEETYRRLQEIKRRYDPQNLFRRNLNVVP
ncbi:FAD-binding oxidoreductase [Brachybacterium sp. DNPG3]